MNKNTDEFQERLKEIFKNEPIAYDFLTKYMLHCHAIDDIIDNEDCRAEFICKTAVETMFVFTHPFFIKHITALKPLAFSIANSFANSCAWEKSKEGWKQCHADVLRHAGCDMLDAVVFLVAGYDTMREISLMNREYSHKRHLNDFIKYENATDKSAGDDDSVQK